MQSKLKALEGQTLLTWPQRREFEVVEVTADRVVFVPKSGKGTRRWIPISTLLDVAEQTWDLSELRQKILINYPNTWNSSYIAAIVREFKK